MHTWIPANLWLQNRLLELWQMSRNWQRQQNSVLHFTTKLSERFVVICKYIYVCMHVHMYAWIEICEKSFFDSCLMKLIIRKTSFSHDLHRALHRAQLRHFKPTSSQQTFAVIREIYIYVYIYMFYCCADPENAIKYIKQKRTVHMYVTPLLLPYLPL